MGKMIISDLELAALDAVASLSEFISNTPESPMSSVQRLEFARLAAIASFKQQVWCIALDYTVDAALLFKLSDGNIDPRPAR